MADTPPLQTTARDVVINSARNLPDLIEKASRVDPALADKWTGKSLAASKTLWGTLAALMIAEAVRRLDLGWSPDVVSLVAGAVVMVAAAGLRLVTEHPITGIFRKATAAEAINAATPGATP